MKRFALVLVVVAGCNGQPQNGGAEIASADTTSPPATLTFAADWSVTQSAPVISGGKATIHYDVARLPDCRATYQGFPAWGIVAYWAVDGGQAFTAPVTQFQNGQTACRPGTSPSAIASTVARRRARR